jgi:Kef-type K+ transport system membrane component KefB
MEKILFSLFIVFAGAKLAGEIFERLNISVVVGEVIVGIIIGSFAPSILRPADVYEVIAEIGVIILLFTVGLETPVDELIKVGKTAALVAILGVVFPFVLGFELLFYLGYPTVQALFLGVSMVATSVGITARVLAELGYLQKKESQIILGAAVVDDILGLIILATLTGVQNGHLSWLKLGILISEVLIFVGFLLFFGARLTRKHGALMEKLEINEAPLVIAVATSLGLAALASYIGMAAIVGAFLAGVIFAEVNETYSLHKQIIPVYELFVPFFFVIIGAKVDINQIANPAVIWLTLAVIVLAIIGKLVGCGLAVVNLGRRVWLRVGIGMIPRGEVGIIVALLGLSMKVIPNSLFSVVVVMSIVTTLIAPFLIKLSFKDKELIS